MQHSGGLVTKTPVVTNTSTPRLSIAELAEPQSPLLTLTSPQMAQSSVQMNVAPEWGPYLGTAPYETSQVVAPASGVADDDTRDARAAGQCVRVLRRRSSDGRSSTASSIVPSPASNVIDPPSSLLHHRTTSGVSLIDLAHHDGGAMRRPSGDTLDAVGFSGNDELHRSESGYQASSLLVAPGHASSSAIGAAGFVNGAGALNGSFNWSGNTPYAPAAAQTHRRRNNLRSKSQSNLSRLRAPNEPNGGPSDSPSKLLPSLQSPGYSAMPVPPTAGGAAMQQHLSAPHMSPSYQALSRTASELDRLKVGGSGLGHVADDEHISAYAANGHVSTSIQSALAHVPSNLTHSNSTGYFGGSAQNTSASLPPTYLPPSPFAPQASLSQQHTTAAGGGGGGVRRLQMLSVEERKRIQQAFDKYDTGKTGSVDSSMIVHLLRDIGHPMPAAQAMDLLHQVDANKNGLMEFDELLQVVHIFKSFAQFRLDPSSSSAGNYRRRRDNDGHDDPSGVTVSVTSPRHSDSPSRRRTGRGQSAFNESIDDDAGGFSFFRPREDQTMFTAQHHIAKAVAKFQAVLPDASLWKWAWDVAMMVMYFYIFCSVTTLYMRSEASLIWEQADYFYAMDILITIPMAIEMVLACFTSYRRPDGAWEEDFNTIRWAYFTSWFVPDLVSLLPLRVFVAEDQTSYDAAVRMMVLGHIRLFRCARSMKLFSTSNQVGMTRDYINFFFVFAPLTLQIVGLMCAIHVYAVLWVRFLGGTHSYGTGIYITMYYFSSVGYGGYEVDPSWSKAHTIRIEWWAIVCSLTALFVNAAVIGSVVRMMGQADVEGSRKSRLVETQAVLNFFGVPTSLQEEILQFQNHVLLRDIKSSYKALVDSLPQEICWNLQVQLHLHMFYSVPVFREAHDTVKISLVQLLNTVICCPEEFLVVSGEVAEDIIFIHYGFVDLLDCNGCYITTLRNGQPFAEALLFAPRSATVLHELSAKSLGYTELLVLSVEGLWEVMDMFPTFAQEVVRIGKRKGMGVTAPLLEMSEVPETVASSFGGAQHTLPHPSSAMTHPLQDDKNPVASSPISRTAQLSPADDAPQQQQQQNSATFQRNARRRSSALMPFRIDGGGQIAFLLGAIQENPDAFNAMSPSVTPRTSPATQVIMRDIAARTLVPALALSAAESFDRPSPTNAAAPKSGSRPSPLVLTVDGIVAPPTPLNMNLSSTAKPRPAVDEGGSPSNHNPLVIELGALASHPENEVIDLDSDTPKHAVVQLHSPTHGVVSRRKTFAPAENSAASGSSAAAASVPTRGVLSSRSNRTTSEAWSGSWNTSTAPDDAPLPHGSYATTAITSAISPNHSLSVSGGGAVARRATLLEPSHANNRHPTGNNNRRVSSTLVAQPSDLADDACCTNDDTAVDSALLEQNLLDVAEVLLAAAAALEASRASSSE